MTQAKFKPPELNATKQGDVSSKSEAVSRKKRIFCSDKCVQIAAWALLTLGLCIIITTFYLAISQQTEDNDDEPINNENQKGNTNDFDFDIDIHLVSRVMNQRVSEKIPTQGCEELYCKMICGGNENLYSTLERSMQLSKCSSVEALSIYRQNFVRGMLRNSWIFVNRTVQELALIHSNITTIKSDAFNTPMFSTTFLLYWSNLNLQLVESGALLGLLSLKYLMIESQIKCLDRAFFQPVQTTLSYLKIHAGLIVSEDQSLFGISKLEKLEYADLSRNNFYGPLTKNSFAATPNLKFLILTKSKITAINDDTFEHLAGKLKMLDLSHNFLTTLNDKALQPLLQSDAHTVINMAMNNYFCDCNISSFAKVFETYRGQFMDALYCKSPHQFYGKLINEIDFNGNICESVATEPTQHDSADEEDNSVSTNQMATTTSNDNSKETSSEEPRNFQMRCHSVFDVFEAELSDSSPWDQNFYVDSDTASTASINSGKHIKQKGLNLLEFDPPTCEFDVEILPNRSAIVHIEKSYTKELSIVWFAEDIQDFSKNSFCMQYPSSIVTEALEENQTYTFCLIPPGENVITPFNCLPLYVPFTQDNDVWIPRDQKPFTIGMLCLIFFMSTFAGAMIAYFGIKTYPDLLEGSKNVLVVKKSDKDKSCYISTISENDSTKKSNLKNKNYDPLSYKNSLSSTSSSSGAGLERLSSLQSNSTNFEDGFTSLPFIIDDKYEMPKPVDKNEFIYAKSAQQNTYVETSPRSPPPLPARNSSEA